MATFIYSTSKSIDCSILINSSELQKLDEILNVELEQIKNNLEEKKSKELKKYIEDDYSFRKLENPSRQELSKKKRELKKEFEQSFLYELKFPEKRKLTIQLTKDKSVEFKSFTEALKSQELRDEIPIGFYFYATYGDFRINIELKKKSLSYRTSPDTSSDARNIFVAIDQWANSVSPSFVRKIWLHSDIPFRFIAWMFFLFTLSIFSFIISSSDHAKENYKKQAYQLLQEGINPENQIRAIEILLALETNFTPNGFQVVIPLWYWVYLVLGVIVCILLSVKPSSIVGIGRGEESIKRWEMYINFIFILIPTFIFLNIITPLLNKWIFGT